MQIDINKKYRTRDGRTARVICTDRKAHNSPVIALIGDSEGAVFGYSADGISSHASPRSDLIEVREPREWRATIPTRNGELCHYAPGDESREGFEVIRVREVIEP